MKKMMFILALGLLGMTACNKDDDAGAVTEIIRLDGENASSPNLQAGRYEHAVKFNANLTGQYEGDLLTGIQVHFYEIPNDTEIEVKVYGPGTGTSPGPVAYSGTVTGLQPNAVNNIEFAPGDEITIGRSDLWLSVGYFIQNQTQVIGCDAGPRDPNGDYLLANNIWTTFQGFTNTESINWNIRGIVER